MKTAQLGELASIVRGISFPKDDKRSEALPGHVACLRTTNVQRTVEWGDLWFVPEVHVKREEQFVRTGDILISTANSYELVGKVAPVLGMPHKSTLGAFISLIRPNGLVDPKFLYHQLAWGKTQGRIRDTASTTTNISNVSTKKLLTLDLFVPELDEQRRIVAEIEKQFSRLDEAVANLQRVKANLKRYRAAVLQSAVDGKLTTLPSAYRTLPFKRLIGRISQGWSPKCDLNREPLPNEWAVITTTAVQPMQYLDGQGKPLPSNLDPRPGIEIQPGDFLMTRKGPRKRAGVACLVRKTRERLMVCDTVYRFRCDETEVIPDYLEIALNAPSVLAAIDKHKAGINESGVSLTHDKLGSVEIPVPSLAEQVLIAAEVDRRLSILRGIEADVDINLQRALVLRQTTLSKAFRQ